LKGGGAVLRHVTGVLIEINDEFEQEQLQPDLAPAADHMISIRQYLERDRFPWVRYALYNGNDHGRTGVGLAVWQD
jgi:hypothetical protein